MPVRDILKEKGDQIYEIRPEETVYEAIRKMADKNIGALLVMDDDQLVGIVSERDYRNKVILKGRTSKTTPVSAIMTTKVYCVTPEESVEACMELMTDHKFRHLPVMKDNRVIGIISIGDLVKSIISRQRGEIHHLRRYITGVYPG